MHWPTRQRIQDDPSVHLTLDRCFGAREVQKGRNAKSIILGYDCRRKSR